MLKSDDFYVVFKLTSGENVMAVLRQEDDRHVLVEHPMVMRSIMNLEAGKEHLTAAPLCAFTDESDFVIPKKNILFMKKLHHMFISHYQRIVNEYESTTMFIPPDDMPPETARKAVQQLKGILGIEEEEIDWKEKLKFLVDGNDTIN